MLRIRGVKILPLKNRNSPMAPTHCSPTESKMLDSGCVKFGSLPLAVETPFNHTVEEFVFVSLPTTAMPVSDVELVLVTSPATPRIRSWISDPELDRNSSPPVVP